jgi:hypothetical protein
MSTIASLVLCVADELASSVLDVEGSLFTAALAMSPSTLNRRFVLGQLLTTLAVDDVTDFEQVVCSSGLTGDFRGQIVAFSWLQLPLGVTAHLS